VSPSLLESIKITAHCSKEMSLGMEDWVDGALEELESHLASEVGEPIEPHLRPHPNSAESSRGSDECEPRPKKKKVDNSRYKLLNPEEMDDLSKAFVPKNTLRMTKWSVSNFELWLTNRNKMVSSESEKCPENLLEAKDPELLTKWLGLFVAETSKVNGDPYPPKTLYELLCGLLRHAR
jgi:hypothetical protein